MKKNRKVVQSSEFGKRFQTELSLFVEILELPYNTAASVSKQEGQHPLTGQRAPPISGGT